MPVFTIETPNGAHLDIEADDHDAALQGAQQWYAQNVTSKTDDSMLGALSQGASDVATGVGKTVKDYISPETGKAILDNKHVQADPKYKSATQGFMYPEDGADNHTMGLDWSKLPRAMVEQAPGLALDLGAQALVPKWMGPIGKYAANAATYGLRNLGNEAEKRAAARTGDTNAEPNAEDKLVALGSTGAQTVLNQAGLNKIISPAKVTGTGLKGLSQAAGNVVKAAGTEGVTSAGQDLISQAATKAGTNESIDPKEVLGTGVMGAATGGLFSSPHASKEAINAARMSGQDGDVHTAMAANRVLAKVSKPSELENPETAYHATTDAIRDVKDELSSVAKNVSNPSTEASNAINRAKDGTHLTEAQLAAVDAEGNDQLSSLVRQATALNKVIGLGDYNTSEGRFAGGMSEFARKWTRPAFYALTGAAALPHVAAEGGVGIDTMAASLPHIAEGMAALYAGSKGLRVIDKMTGMSSPARQFAEKFGDASGNVRIPPTPSTMTQAGVSVPSVTPQNSLTAPQPWGPVAPPPQRFKPDIVEPGIAKIVEKLQNQKRRDTVQQALPLLRQLSAQNQPAPQPPGIDASALNEQVKSALLMASARRKVAGQQQAEAEADQSPMVNEQGGLDAIRNPAMGKRANELIAAANALARLRRQPEEEPNAPPIAPEMPQAPQPQAPAPQGGAQSMADILRRLQAQPAQPEAPQSGPAAPEPFVLPESPHVFKEPKEAAHAIYQDALAGGKEIRNAEGYKAGTARRLAGEEAIYNTISKALSSVKERGDFHKYLSALWGSDSPEVVTKVREHMLAEFPQAAEAINKHLSDEAIKGLWTKPKKKK